MPPGLRTVIAIMCLLLAVAACRGALDSLAGRLGTDALNARNDAYLTATFNKALVGFGVLSGIKAGLAVIEGSTAGVSVGATMNLQVGDVVQSAYDYVDIAWRTVLLGCVTLLSIRYLLQAVALLDGYVLGFTLLALGISLAVRGGAAGWTRARDITRDLLSISVVATLAVFYILPVSVWGASRLSRAITLPSIEEAQRGFTEARSTLFPDEDDATDGVFAKIKQLPERIQQITVHLTHRSREMAVWTIKLIAGYVFDCIVFPAALFALLLWLTRSVMRYVFHRNLQSSLRDDIRRLLVTRSAGRVA